jgi:hypothetical protein
VACWVLVIVGVWLRVVPWLWNRSLWLDEAYLAVNLRFRDWGGLLQTLEHDQAAPIGFLMVSKAMGTLFEWNERALRLLPLLAGVASLFLLHAIAKRTLRAASRPVAVALLALSPMPLYYASELKPYSVDLFAALLFLWLGLPLLREAPRGTNWWMLVTAGALAPWFSFPAVFVLAGIGIVAMVAAWKRGDRAGFARIAVASGLWAASFGVQYLVALRDVRGNEFLREYWSEFFVPSGEGAGAMAAWGGRTASDAFAGATGNTMALLAALPFATGCVALWRRCPWTLALILAPAAVAVGAAALHLYPVGGRLALYLVPAVVLPVAEGVRGIRWPGRGGAAIASGLLVWLLLVPPAIHVAPFFVRPIATQESRPLMALLKERLQPGDRVYIHKGAEPAFRFYAPDFGLADRPVHIGVRGRRDPTVHRADLATLAGSPRVWVLLTHTTWHDAGDERQLVLSYLDAMGRRLLHRSYRDADLLLFDLTRSTAEDPMRRPGR